MGIINVTPDSFYAGSRSAGVHDVAERVKSMLSEGVDIIDLGAYSSRPGAQDVSEDEEMRRLATGMEAIRSVSNDIPVSVDTFRASVAKAAIKDMGADMINDISGGDLDRDMFKTVAELKVPYILMHMRGTPSTMQSLTDYTDVTADVVRELSEKLAVLEELGVCDIIADPGFGFSKTLEQNYDMLRNLPHIAATLKRPLLIGISRKSMLTKALDITPDDALPATVAANTLALAAGASIIRVHDVAAARQALTITQLTFASRPL